MTTSRSVLLVHGRDFKPGREALFDLSLGALRAGVERDFPDHLAAFDGLHVDMAYFGDLNNELLSASGRCYDEELDLGDRKNALRQLQQIPLRKKFGIRPYDRLPGKSAVPEFFADFIFPICCLFGFGMPIIRRKARDFADYLTRNTDFAVSVQQRVRERLCALLDRNDQIMLMSHGTGSVVAYDVLWQLSHDLEFQERYGSKKIEAWVTMGSPLGNRRVRRRLEGTRGRTQKLFPSNVICWHNVSAEDDYTCHDKTLADDFKKMMSQRLVSAVTDYRVFNHAVRYGRSNPHSSVGYYIHPRVAKIIVDWLCHTSA